jgi:hypothetical protein
LVLPPGLTVSFQRDAAEERAQLQVQLSAMTADLKKVAGVRVGSLNKFAHLLNHRIGIDSDPEEFIKRIRDIALDMGRPIGTLKV